MTATSSPVSAREAPAIEADLLAGVVLQVADLASTRAFYERIFADRPGQWLEEPRRLVYRFGPQTIQFIRRSHPRTLPESGQHQAYRVRPERLPALAQELAQSGASVHWWREDRPEEHQVTAYLHDPSGNRLQLVPSEDPDLLLDHAAIEVHEFDYVCSLYVTALGGERDYYHGWRTVDAAEARAWATGDDPCAPWTRKDNPHYRDFLVDGRPTAQSRLENVIRQPLRVARPNGQLFVRFGPTVLGLVSATRVRQEPPEEQVKGTPRLVFRTTRSPAQAMAFLSGLPIPHKREGASIFFRDADGNFAELCCQG